MMIPVFTAFARSGGTYANRVLGSHADLAVLSEVNPAFSVRPPSWQAANWLGLTDSAEPLPPDYDFAGQVEAIARRAAAGGKTLIVRDWVTVNFLSGAWHGVSAPSMLLESVHYLRAAGIEPQVVVLVREALAVFYSLKKNIRQFADLSLEAFADAYLRYARAVSGYPRFKLEDLQADPADAWQRIFSLWGLPFDASALERYAAFDRCTGDNTLDRAALTHYEPESPSPSVALLLAEANRLLGYDA